MMFSKQTGRLFLLTAIVIVVSLLVAFIYYRTQHGMKDPRVSEVKKMLLQFDEMMSNQQFDEAFSVLAGMELILSTTPGYKDSYEMGVVMNNRATIFLLMALYDTLGVDSVQKQELLIQSEQHVLESIEIYESWLKKYGNLPVDSILLTITPYFHFDDLAFKNRSVNRIMMNRVKEITEAQVETKRRASVSYSNLGIIRRHQLRLNEAVDAFETSLKMWPDNLSAKNNLNNMLGMPLEKRTVLEKLFPPDRLKE